MQGPGPLERIDPRPKSQFRLRLLTLLLLILVVLLIARRLSTPSGRITNPTPTLALSTGTPVPSPTVTDIPDTLFTPEITFTTFPKTISTPVPSLPPTRGIRPASTTATGTAAPATITATRRSCSGYGKVVGKIWIVAGCDTLLRISQVTGIGLDMLLRANPEITNPDVIFPNQRILLPGLQIRQGTLIPGG